MAVPLLISIIYGPILTVAENRIPSLPESSAALVGWQDNPGRRGTWDIVINCLTTIVACTWSIQHLNVPASQDGPKKKLLRSCKWMAITVFFPEFILVHAFLELILAVQATEMVKERTGRKIAEYPWLIKLLVHQDSARNSPQGQISQNNKGRHNDAQEPEWTLTHSYFANMGGFFYEDHFPLTASQYAQEENLYDVPRVTEEDIKDKGKQDIFAKGLAVLQISQLVLSLIVRKTRHLRFSQLEMLTLAFAVCGVGTYTACWYKPQGVGIPSKVKGRGPEVPNFSKTYDNFWEVLTNSKRSTKDIDRVKNDNIPLGTSEVTRWAIPGLAVMSAAFGCLHLIAWNFEFPTEREKLLWRIATVLSIAIPVIGLTTIPLSQVAVQAGNPRDFMWECLYVLRELSWYSANRNEFVEACRELENIYANSNTKCPEAQRPYKDIFTDQSTGTPLGTKIIAFVEKRAPFEERVSLELPKEFGHQFTQLMDCMEGIGPKKLVENAKTNVFPQKSLLRKEVNLFILYATSLVYCLSRLAIIGLALSSLRSMPDDVYVTTWTQNIPTVQ
jgi:hypothetical protein